MLMVRQFMFAMAGGSVGGRERELWFVRHDAERRGRGKVGKVRIFSGCVALFLGAGRSSAQLLVLLYSLIRSKPPQLSRYNVHAQSRRAAVVD